MQKRVVAQDEQHLAGCCLTRFSLVSPRFAHFYVVGVETTNARELCLALLCVLVVVIEGCEDFAFLTILLKQTDGVTGGTVATV